MPAPRTNLPEYSVSEISQEIKRTMEDRFGHVRLRGEISGFRGPHSSGHCYFSLKDQNAKIDAIVWRGNFRRVQKWLEEGLEVIATGKVTTYPAKSGYQIVIDSLEPAGVGALLAQLEERRKKLAAEGLFDAGRKRPLPYLPRVVGVVTSPTGPSSATSCTAWRTASRYGCWYGRPGFRARARPRKSQGASPG